MTMSYPDWILHAAILATITLTNYKRTNQTVHAGIMVCTFCFFFATKLFFSQDMSHIHVVLVIFTSHRMWVAVRCKKTQLWGFQPGHTQTSLLSFRGNLENLLVESQDMILSNKRLTMALIRLHGCAGLSVPLLFAQPPDRFSRDKACVSKWMVT